MTYEVWKNRLGGRSSSPEKGPVETQVLPRQIFENLSYYAPVKTQLLPKGSKNCLRIFCILLPGVACHGRRWRRRRNANGDEDCDTNRRTHCLCKPEQCQVIELSTWGYFSFHRFKATSYSKEEGKRTSTLPRFCLKTDFNQYF